MELLITPEPTDEERRALAAAVADEPRAPTPYDSGWRASADDDADEPRYAGARPRSSRGATRA